MTSRPLSCLASRFFWAFLFVSPPASAQCESDVLENPSGEQESLFGWATAVDGSRALVGVRDGGDPDTGSAYAYRRDGAAWVLDAELVPSEPSPNARFGSAVALEGDTAVVGAFRASVNTVLGGAVYVFQRSASDWQEEARLEADDAAASDQFGSAVAIDGAWVFVGAPGDDDAGSNSGSTYVFERVGTDWNFRQKLLASDASSQDFFGTSIAMNDEYAFVGARGAPGAASNSGAVYVFERSGTEWTESQKLTAADGSLSDRFGFSVGLDGDVAVIGAPGDGADDEGAVFLFTNDAPGWLEQEKLTAAERREDDELGSSVAVSGGIIVAGAWSHDGSGPDSGAAFVFESAGSSWQQTSRIVPGDATIHDRFAWSVALDAGELWVGAPQADATSLNTGRAYVFQVADAGGLSCAAPSGFSEGRLATELVASGFDRPLFLTTPTHEVKRLFVVEQHTARIMVIKENEVLATPFLDLGGAVSTGSEQGLLGLAFHPNYAANELFYIAYTDTLGDIQIEEYRASAGDPDVADPAPLRTILSEVAAGSIHNGGCLQFGPDGFLYVSLGDSTDSDAVQDGTSNLGKILRLDVDVAAPHIPATNPFVGNPGVNDEIWAIGFRNPWRFSFDRETGDLWLSDVGSTIEEIDFQPAGSPGGENYGWPCVEAQDCTNDVGPGCTCGDSGLTPPVHWFKHNELNLAVIGGYVYRGERMPWLRGHYLFGDWGSGNVWTARLEAGALTDVTNRTTELEPPGALTIDNITSFGEDGDGELYVVDSFGGEIYKIVPDCGSERFCVSSRNSSGTFARIDRFGSTRVSKNDMHLTVQGMVPEQFGIFFYGPRPEELPFGDGVICVSPGTSSLWRLEPAMAATVNGTMNRFLDFDNPPAGSGPGEIEPGSTWYFQFWYRDPLAMGSGFNLSDGLAVTFCP